MLYPSRKNHLALAVITAVGSYCSLPAIAENVGLEEIVVTAQRRAESVQDASVSIDVLSGDVLADAGVTQASDLVKLAPGVQISMGGTALQIHIRGAGDFSTTSYTNAAVLPNFDGVAAARTQYVNGTFFDLERMEILKGPQGTIYGRNAVGGALNIIPRKPEIGEFSGYASLGLQNYDGQTVEGAFNIPVNEDIAMRASYQVVDRSGYVDDGTDDDEHQSYRLQYLHLLSDDVTVRVTGNYQHFGGRGGGRVVWLPEGTALSGPITPSDPWTSINDSLRALNQLVADAPGPVVPADIDTSKVEQDLTTWGIHAQIDWQLDIGTLTLIPAYQYVEDKSQAVPALNFYTANAVTDEPTTSDGYSFEARLTDETDVMKWVAGLYYFKEDQYSANYLDLANVVNKNYIGDLTTESVAAFGEINYSFTDRLRGIMGLRYTEETKTVDSAQYDRAALAIQCPNGGGGLGGDCTALEVAGEYEAERVNYRAGFEYDLGEESMLFATVATGFKSGGQTNADLEPYKPEDLTAYTVGSKNRFFDRSLQVNAELFYIDYEDHQEKFSLRDRRGQRVSALTNAGSATAKGASLDVMWLPTPNDRLRVAAEYVNSEYGDFQYYDYRAAPPSVGCPITPVSGPDGATFSIDCSGFQMTRTPEWSGSVSYTRTFDLPGGATLDVTPDMTFASSRWLSGEFDANQHVSGYEVYNLSATYRPVSDKYSVQFFVRNITDEPVYTAAAQAPFVAGYSALTIGPPRTYGARFRINF